MTDDKNSLKKSFIRLLSGNSKSDESQKNSLKKNDSSFKPFWKNIMRSKDDIDTSVTPNAMNKRLDEERNITPSTIETTMPLQHMSSPTSKKKVLNSPFSTPKNNIKTESGTSTKARCARVCKNTVDTHNYFSVPETTVRTSTEIHSTFVSASNGKYNNVTSNVQNYVSTYKMTNTVETYTCSNSNMTTAKSNDVKSVISDKDKSTIHDETYSNSHKHKCDDKSLNSLASSSIQHFSDQYSDQFQSIDDSQSLLDEKSIFTESGTSLEFSKKLQYAATPKEDKMSFFDVSANEINDSKESESAKNSTKGEDKIKNSKKQSNVTMTSTETKHTISKSNDQFYQKIHYYQKDEFEQAHENDSHVERKITGSGQEVKQKVRETEKSQRENNNVDIKKEILLQKDEERMIEIERLEREEETIYTENFKFGDFAIEYQKLNGRNIECLVGKWQLIPPPVSDEIEEIMKALGIGFLKRKVMNSFVPFSEIQIMEKNIDSVCNKYHRPFMMMMTSLPLGIVKKAHIHFNNSTEYIEDSDTGTWESTSFLYEGRLIQKRIRKDGMIMYDTRGYFDKDPKGQETTPVLLFRWSLHLTNGKILTANRWMKKMH